MFNKFKAGDKVRCIKSSEYSCFSGKPGEIFTVSSASVSSVRFTEDAAERGNDPTRFELIEQTFPLPAAEVSQGRHFEVRAASLPLDRPKAITRKSSVADCETFVQENAANYRGPFEIVEVQIIQRTTVLRKVKREAVTTYKLVDA
jgi:hypothetical protein